MTTFVMAISFGGSIYDWKSSNEIVLWALSGLLFIAFSLTQYFHPFVSAEHKLYPTHFLRMPVMVNLQVIMVCAAVDLFVSESLTRLAMKSREWNLASHAYTGTDLLHSSLFPIFSGKPYLLQSGLCRAWTRLANTR